MQFSATVSGLHNPPQGVVWSILGNANSGTTISSSGLLAVHANETATQLTVVAKSDFAPDIVREAIVFLGNMPATVTSIDIEPGAVTLQAGAVHPFNATVHGNSNPSQFVTWEVAGNTSSGTSIAMGLLFVGFDETAKTLTITATSVADTSISAYAVVTIETQTSACILCGLPLCDCLSLSAAASVVRAAVVVDCFCCGAPVNVITTTHVNICTDTNTMSVSVRTAAKRNTKGAVLSSEISLNQLARTRTNLDTFEIIVEVMSDTGQWIPFVG